MNILFDKRQTRTIIREYKIVPYVKGHSVKQADTRGPYFKTEISSNVHVIPNSRANVLAIGNGIWQ